MTASTEVVHRPRGRDLAREVVLQALRHPERHDQRAYVADRGNEWTTAKWLFPTRYELGEDQALHPVMPDAAMIARNLGSCNTTACLAGWTIILGHDDPIRTLTDCAGNDSDLDFRAEALKLLGFDDGRWTNGGYDVNWVFTRIMDNQHAVFEFARLFDLDLDELRAQVARERAEAST